MRLRKLFLSLLVSLIFLFFILKIINIGDLKSIFLFPTKILVFCFFLYFISNILRALRFKLYLDMGLMEIISMTFLHNMINNIMPFRAGELSILFLNKERKLKSLSSLFYSRIFDVIAIISLLSFSLFFPETSKIFFLSSRLIIALLLFFFAAIFFILKHRLYKVLYKIKFFRMNKKSKFFADKIEEFIKMINFRKAVLSYFFSLMIWLLNFYIANLVISNFGINLKWHEIIFTFTFTTLISLMPIHGFLGLGTLEAGWAFVLVSFGISKERAILSGFLFHFINILFFTILGVIGLIYYIVKFNYLFKFYKRIINFKNT